MALEKKGANHLKINCFFGLEIFLLLKQEICGDKKRE
jgi:hypothetical protein